MKEKLKTKDLIYAGAFAAIYLVLMLLIVMVSGMILPILYLLSPFIVGLVGATVYLVYVSKVKKFGAILILSVLFALIAGAQSIYAVVWIILTGVLAELVARAGQYQSKKMFMFSYWVFNLNMVGPFMMLVIAKEKFIELSRQYRGAAFAETIDKFTPNWIIFVLAGIALIGAILGTVIGGSLIKKHFEKAGVV